MEHPRESLPPRQEKDMESGRTWKSEGQEQTQAPEQKAETEQKSRKSPKAWPQARPERHR